MPALLLATVTLAVVLGVFLELAMNALRLRRLGSVPPRAPEAMPSVSVVIAARNEVRAIEHALRSVLALRGATEVIVVDDRSDDGTGEVLGRLAASEPRLRVLRVSELPPGWLGKNHALHLGAGEAGGELLLFTDADVVMAPDTLQRAVAYLEAEGVDHLAAGPRIPMPGTFLQAFGAAFVLFFNLFARPWKARDPRSRSHVGVGAFNLIRARAYRDVGTHAAIAMRPDDDLKLGKLVKNHGLRQDFVHAPSHVCVEWYASVGEMVRGLRKNAFPGVDYRVSMVVFATAVHLAFFVWPFVAAVVVAGPARWLYAAAAALLLVAHGAASRDQGAPAWHAVLFPAATLLFVFVLWNSTVYVVRNRGIEWRGTHYPLEALRANRI